MQPPKIENYVLQNHVIYDQNKISITDHLILFYKKPTSYQFKCNNR